MELALPPIASLIYTPNSNCLFDLKSESEEYVIIY